MDKLTREKQLDANGIVLLISQTSINMKKYKEKQDQNETNVIFRKVDFYSYRVE